MKKSEAQEIAMKTIAALEAQDGGICKSDMDTDGDGSISISELKAALAKMNTAKEKRKAIMVYMGDKVADLFVVTVALVVFVYTGNLLL